jgi:DNA-binding response OmpR family regulator
VRLVSVSVAIGLSKEVEEAVVGHWSATVGLCRRLSTTGKEWLREVSSDNVALAVIDAEFAGGPSLLLIVEARGRGAAAPILLMMDPEQFPGPEALLAQGANDVLIRPWDPAEMMTKVVAAKQRFCGVSPLVLKSGSLRADLGAREVRLRGQVLHLTPIQFGLLVRLMRTPGSAVSQRELNSVTLGAPSDGARIRKYVSEIRAELATHGCRDLIVTVRPHSYVLVVKPL